MPYALFSNDAKLSKAYPTEADVWKQAQKSGLVVDVVSDEGQPALVDHVLFYCPFCGTKVQTPEEVEAKAAHEDEGEEEPRQA